ncbi:GGDEF domain-containing protein [Neobacillus endophyticus]|uniref:GGDEF domain-containing protein n=1 Tax=Neobacillus endophyticus TaxID=2738405 RepID=UPI001FE73276|nr:diguanylate cyclase [Neobacillus endophyticus]
MNRKSSLKRKIAVGVFGGVAGMILMQYSMHIENIIVDLRHVPVILLAFYAGPVPAFVAMIIMTVRRLFDGITPTTISAAILGLLVATGAVSIARGNLSRYHKLFLSFTWNNIVFSILAINLIRKWDVLLAFIPVYWIVSYIGGFVAFYIIDYIRSIQYLFEKYKSESTVDGLTGLNNYRKFDDVFNSLIQKAGEKQEKISLLYIDIDHFKKINDQYGHTNGDKVLKELGEILQNNTRSFDIVSRNGGEEFTVILLDCDLDKANEIAERIRKNVEEYPFHLAGKKIHITVSIGVSCYNDTTSEPNNIIDDADQALYKAKNSGRNRVCLADNRLVLT